MKKLFSAVLLVVALLAVTACASTPKLHVINWGDYMDKTLIAQFEAEYGVEVVYREVGSNEEMATLLQAGQSPYDVCIPSDYMLDKLIDLGLIQTIDFGQLEHYGDLTIIPDLFALYAGSGLSPYVVPYAWGTMGILYDSTDAGLKTLIETEGWAALFEYTDIYDVGMYDSPRDAVAAALLYKGYDVNSADAGELAEAEAALVDGSFSWGEDNLRGLVISGVLDMALVYSGDYFSEYYFAVEDGLEVTFDYYVPETTNVWMDAMAIATSSENPGLAHQFIDFFLREDIALQNSDYIGYAPCYEEIYSVMVTDPDYGYDMPNFNPYPEGSNREIYVYGSDLRSQQIVAIRDNAKMSD
jgi:spermidine/putrescine-binding protein